MGMGRLHDELVEQIRVLGLEDRFLMPGWVDHVEMPVWMNACDLFVLPSISESFGVVQVEAMACGKPVVATINGGSEEIVTSADVGILVPPGDAGALADGIAAGLRHSWDTAAITFYAARYRWDTAITEIMNQYQIVLRRRSSSEMSEQVRP